MEQIKTITDKQEIEKIVTLFFKTNTIQLKTKSGDLVIKYVGYNDGKIALKIPYVKNITDACLVTLRIKTTTIHAHLLFKGKQNDVFLFVIDKLQMIEYERKEERKQLSTDLNQGKHIFYITNFISDFIIQNVLTLEQKKIERIIEPVKYELSKLFQYVKIFFSNEKNTDPRIVKFTKNREPIYIKSVIKSPGDEAEKSSYYSYRNDIYLKDYLLQHKKELISEISVPLLYKNKIPFGYMQINHSVSLPEDALSIVRKHCMVIEKLFHKNSVFPDCGDKLIVSNISRNGFGVVFNERKHIRCFKVNSFGHYELLLPDGRNIPLLAMTRNITILENKVVRIGCEITEVEESAKKDFYNIVDSLSAAK